MHPVDEELLGAAEVDLRDLAQGETCGGGQKTAHIELEAGGWRACDLGDVGDLAVGEEAALREDGYFVGVDGGVHFVEDAGDLDDAAGGEGAEALAVVPLGAAADVDGEVAAMRALDDEGLGGGVDADDGGVKLVDVGAGVAGADYADVEGGLDLAGDLAAAIDQDRLGQIEVEMQANRLRDGDDEGRGKIDADGGGGEGRGFRRDGGRGAGDGVEIAEGRRAEGDLNAGIGADGNVVHVEQGLEAVEAGEVDGGLTADEGDAAA